MMPQFEEYPRTSGRIGTAEMMLTIQKDGAITINRPSWEAFGQPKYCALLYDRREKILGLRKVAEDYPNAYAVQPAASGKSFMINGRGFCIYYAIPTGQARRYPAVVVDGVLQVDLKQAGTLVISNRVVGEWKRKQAEAADEHAHPAE